MLYLLFLLLLLISALVLGVVGIVRETRNDNRVVVWVAVGCICLVAFGFLCFVTALFVYHTYIISQNSTTHENLKNISAKYPESRFKDKMIKNCAKCLTARHKRTWLKYNIKDERFPKLK